MFAGPLGRSAFTPPTSSFESPLYGLVSLRRSHGSPSQTASQTWRTFLDIKQVKANADIVRHCGLKPATAD